NASRASRSLDIKRSTSWALNLCHRSVSFSALGAGLIINASLNPLSSIEFDKHAFAIHSLQSLNSCFSECQETRSCTCRVRRLLFAGQESNSSTLEKDCVTFLCYIVKPRSVCPCEDQGYAVAVFS